MLYLYKVRIACTSVFTLNNYRNRSVHLSVIDEVTEDSIVSENDEQIPVTLVPDSTSTPRLSSIRKELEQSLVNAADASR